jgi:hypothetical protein
MGSIISIWPVLIAAAVSTVLGSLWFGPWFGRAWAHSIGMKAPEDCTPEEKRQGMKKALPLSIISSLISATVIGHLLVFASAFTGTTGIAAAFANGFWLWIGIAVPILLGAVLWEQKPWKWWFIMISYYLVSFILQGIVFTL